MSKKIKHTVIISGGGTGGHIYPAISIANAMKEIDPSLEFLFVGAEGKMEMEKVPQAGYKIEGLNIAGLQRKLSLKNLVLPFKIIGAVLKAGSIIKNFNPQVVIGVGGYASAAVVYAAGKKINFYKIDPISDQGIQKMAEAISGAVKAVKEAVTELRNLKNTQKIIECVIKINSIENNADDIFDMSIERLFESDVDAKELIKRREIYQVMEVATDKCEDAGNVIESIVVKYA